MPPHQKTMISNTHKARCFLWRQNNPEVNYSPTRISGGECFWRKYHAASKGNYNKRLKKISKYKMLSSLNFDKSMQYARF
jgi:hypothetical protein